jgi:uncharacterized protein
MPEDLMRYDQLAQNALRGVVRDALRKVEKSGLPGDHHFYIAFNTRYPGVNIGERLAERYPREMTVVLQHQFYNLIVTEERFQVELSFDNIPEKLIVPFASVKGFLDPAVQFGLQFEVANVEGFEQSDDAKSAKSSVKSTSAKSSEKTHNPDLENSDDETSPTNDGPKVVSLDAFRKK